MGRKPYHKIIANYTLTCDNKSGYRFTGIHRSAGIDSRFSFMLMNKLLEQLDIYIDESGNFDNYSKHNLIYSVAFIMVDSSVDNLKPLSIYKNKLLKIIGGDHFVHTGNLVRGEKPYKGMLIRDRQDLFYILFLLAKHSKYKAICSIAEKKNIEDDIYSGIAETIVTTIKQLTEHLNKYQKVIIHYDNGQEFVRKLLSNTFKAINKNVSIVKTLQEENPFMQVADLFSYFELIRYKISKTGLSKYEINFFGLPRKIKKDYLSQLEDKYLILNHK